MTTAPVPRTITSNVTRETFNVVKNNPGIPRAELIRKLEAAGQLRASAASMTSQLIRNGNIEYIGNGLFVTQDEYSPLVNDTPRPKRAVKAKPSEAAPQSVGLPAILSVSVHDPVPTPASAPTYATPDDWTVDSVIGSLNVRQAMAVYSELRNIFGA